MFVFRFREILRKDKFILESDLECTMIGLRLYMKLDLSLYV